MLALQAADPEQAKGQRGAHTPRTELFSTTSRASCHTPRSSKRDNYQPTQNNPALNCTFVNDAQGRAILISQVPLRALNNNPGASPRCMPTCYWPAWTAPPATWAGAGFGGDPNAQIQRQLIVVGGAHDGEVLARGMAMWAAVPMMGCQHPLRLINEHYVDACCWWAPKARCRACASRNAGALGSAGASLRQPGERSFTVMQGQTLAGIARATLGDEHQKIALPRPMPWPRMPI